MSIPCRTCLSHVIRILALGTIASVAFAAEKFDLKRITPVPDTEPIPVVDFFRPQLLSQPQLNPSGTHIAAIVTVAEDQHQLLVYDLKTQKIETVGGIGDKDIYQVSWLNDQRLVFSLSQEKKYGLGMLAAEVGALDRVYPLLQYYGSSVIGVPRKNRLQPLVWNRWGGDNGRDGGVVEVNTNKIGSGSGARLSMGSPSWWAEDEYRENNQRHIVKRYPIPEGGNVYGYLTDRDDQLAFAFTTTDGQYTLQRLVGEEWVKCPVNLDQIDVWACGDEPGQLVVVGPYQEGKPRALQLMDAATGQLGEVLLQDKAYDFDGWLYHNPATRELLGAAFTRNGPRMVWFNEDYKNLQKVIDGFFPGLVARIIGSNEAQNLFLVSTFSDRQPAIYSWVDLEKHTVGLIKNSKPWIDPKRMQPMNIIKFKTRDGRQLDAYLTLPAGASKTNPPPLVVLCHGGPWARDTWVFNGTTQFLASRGYAVLQPNYRGSTGYNWMFPKEDEYDFRKMHDDVTDATKSVMASGLIDSGRIAIAGGSFGGYLAVSGVVNEPALYRCAVTLAGVFDWEQQIKDSKYFQYDSPRFAWMMRKLGDPKKQPEKFDAISPGRHVDKIRVPVFVAGGKEDGVVEIQQSKRLISELAKYHVPHETMLVRDEGHGMGHLDKEVELYTRIEAFLAKYLKPVQPVTSVP